MKKKIFLISFFLLLSDILFAQTPFIDSLLANSKILHNDSSIINNYLKIAKKYQQINLKDSSLIYFNKAEKLAKKLSLSTNKKNAEIGTFLLAATLYNKGRSFYIFSELNKSEKNLNLTLDLTKSLLQNSKNEYIKTEAMKINTKVYMEIANIYIDKGYYSIALENTIQAQIITDSLIIIGALPEKETAVQYFYLGLINYFLKNYQKSLAYYKKSKQISEKYNNEQGIINCNNNIGIVESKLNRIDTALMYFNKTLEYLKENNDPITKAQTYDNMADCYLKQQNYKKAELYLAKAMIITEKYDIKQGKIYIMFGLADLYNKTEKYDKAFSFASKALSIAEEIESVSMVKDAYYIMFQIYENKHDYKNALAYHKKYKSLEDSIFNKEKNKQIQETEAKYQANKNQQEIDKQKLELAKRDSKIRIKEIQNYIFTAVVIFLLIIILIIYITLKQKQNTNRLIKKQNTKITDSIEYAEKIQKAALPSEKVLSQLFKSHFTLFKPLQIVSGDFYWAVKKYNFIIFAAADCTGHGVPGAFVSMLGISFLNELTLISDLRRPDRILEEMRSILKKSFRQTGKENEQTDGIDIALCSINTETNELYFAGANNPAWLIRENKIRELKPIPNPIGIYYKELTFKMETVQLQKDDIIYLFTDGYADQFGGDSSKPQKYTVKRFKDLLLKIYKKPMPEQKEILETDFNNWKKDNKQIDDILIFGIKF